MKTCFNRVLLPLLLALPAVVQAQFTFTTNNGAITITQYTGPGGEVVIPSATNGLPVTSIGNAAFFSCANLTLVMVPGSVSSIGNFAFESCMNLTGVYFAGNAPSLGATVFGYTLVSDSYDANAVVYYLPGTTGWDTTFGGVSTALWFLPNPLILNSPSFGVQSNGFSFVISWATNLSVVVEACTNLADSVWDSVETNTLTDGWSAFSDPQWTNYPNRFYRLRSP